MTRPDNKDRATHSRKASAKPADESKGRPGMPDETSVLSEKTFTSPKGKKYRIIETDETDPYDDAPPPPKKRRSERTDP